MHVVFHISIVFVRSPAAQTLNVQQAFAAGTKNAESEKFEMAVENYGRTLLLNGIKRQVRIFSLAFISFSAVVFIVLKQAEKAALKLDEAINLCCGNYQKAFTRYDAAFAAFENAVRFKPVAAIDARNH